MADVIDEFDKLMAQRIKKAVPQQVQWAKVASVNWDEKTCEATDLDTDLPFLGISLGIGSMHVKPKVGSLILVGLIENSETKPFLLQAEAIEEYEIKATKIDLKNDEIVFKTLLNELLMELKTAIVQTPSGPGNFAPNNVAKFEEINGKINQLFK